VRKIIVITGAGLGLGRAVARRLASEGHTLVLLGRTVSKVQAVAEELGEPAFAVECDVTSPDSVRAAFAAIAVRHAKIDVLINNAAIYEPFMVADARDDQVMTAMMTNFAGPIFCCRSAIPMMATGGHIINVSSESVSLTFPMLSLYQSTKAGLERFTGSLGDELRAQGIRVSTVRAGPMMDEGMTLNWDPAVAMQFHQQCVRVGLDLMTRPISQVKSVTDVFAAIIDLPADVHISLAVIEARHP
jgi:meso-butanediol dehydrogenase / (S,S)-butanediol dehydrogenase / diacetyl reductase